MGSCARADQEAGWGHHRACQEETEYGDKYTKVHSPFLFIIK